MKDENIKALGGRRMKWCEAHNEPVWVYNDGSWSCWWQSIVETQDEGECKVVDAVPKGVFYVRPGCKCEGCDD